MDDAAIAAEMKALAALAWNTLTPDEQAEWKRIEGRGGRATLGQRRRMRQLRARIAASRTLEVEERLRDLAERLARAGD